MDGASEATTDHLRLRAVWLAVKNARSTKGGKVLRECSVRGGPTHPVGDFGLIADLSRHRSLLMHDNVPALTARHNGWGAMTEQRETSTSSGDTESRKATWVRREDIPAFSPGPGFYIQPVIGETVMTCWTALDPGAVVPDHNHVNEQLGVVIEGSIDLTVNGEMRTVGAGEAYVVPPYAHHSAVIGDDGVLIIETFVPVRDDYVKAWKAATGQ
jgi:quercetin dioxygenase-like cupin family protein